VDEHQGVGEAYNSLRHARAPEQQTELAHVELVHTCVYAQIID